jgi:hypothetical protein
MKKLNKKQIIKYKVKGESISYNILLWCLGIIIFGSLFLFNLGTITKESKLFFFILAMLSAIVLAISLYFRKG